MIIWSKKMGWHDVQLTLEQLEGVNRIESNPGICASPESLNLTNHGPCSPVCNIHYWKYPCVSGPTQFKPVLFRGLTVLWEGICPVLIGPENWSPCLLQALVHMSIYSPRSFTQIPSSIQGLPTLMVLCKSFLNASGTAGPPPLEAHVCRRCYFC